MTAYLARAKIGEIFGGKGVPPGTTVGQALQAQSKWEVEQAAKQAEEAALKKELEQDRATALEALNKVVTVTLVSKQELPTDFDARRFHETRVLIS